MSSSYCYEWHKRKSAIVWWSFTRKSSILLMWLHYFISTTGGLGLLGLYINENNVGLINQIMETLTEYCQVRRMMGESSKRESPIKEKTGKKTWCMWFVDTFLKTCKFTLAFYRVHATRTRPASPHTSLTAWASSPLSFSTTSIRWEKLGGFVFRDDPASPSITVLFQKWTAFYPTTITWLMRLIMLTLCRMDLVLELKNNASKLLLAIMESRTADSENVAEKILYNMNPKQVGLQFIKS